MLLALLLACAEEPPPAQHRLLDFFEPLVQLNTGSVPGGPEVIQLFVHPKMVGKCHPIPTLTATLDGKPMTRLTGRVMGPEPYDRDCSINEFSLDPKEIVVGPSHALVVSDGATTWRMAISDVFSPRVATGPTAELAAGDPVTLTWSPATDVVAEQGDIGFELVAGAKRVVVKRKDITFAPGALTFTMPPGISGDVTLSVYGTAALQPAITACDGPKTCGVSREYDVPAVTLKVKASDAVAAP
jgi:hypothetical protein